MKAFIAQSFNSVSESKSASDNQNSFQFKNRSRMDISLLYPECRKPEEILRKQRMQTWIKEILQKHKASEDTKRKRLLKAKLNLNWFTHN